MFHLQLALVAGLSLVNICAAGGKEKFDKAIQPLRGLLQAKIFNNGITKAKFERNNVDGSQNIVGVVQAPKKAPAYELSQLEQDLEAKVDASFLRASQIADSGMVRYLSAGVIGVIVILSIYNAPVSADFGKFERLLGRFMHGGYNALIYPVMVQTGKVNLNFTWIQLGFGDNVWQSPGSNVYTVFVGGYVSSADVWFNYDNKIIWQGTLQPLTSTWFRAENVEMTISPTQIQLSNLKFTEFQDFPLQLGGFPANTPEEVVQAFHDEIIKMFQYGLRINFEEAIDAYAKT